jgi:hypothetical protein
MLLTTTLPTQSSYGRYIIHMLCVGVCVRMHAQINTFSAWIQTLNIQHNACQYNIYCYSISTPTCFSAIAPSSGVTAIFICFLCVFKTLCDYFIVRNHIFIVTTLCTLWHLSFSDKMATTPWRWCYSTETCWCSNTVTGNACLLVPTDLLSAKLFPGY